VRAGDEAAGVTRAGAACPVGDSDPLVRAAGGVVWRPDGRGGVELLVVHRPRRADWSFPKGKLEPGEDEAACALREVAEETGLRCRLGAELGRVRYRDQRDRPKVVRWWAMTALSGSFQPNAEVDELVWLAPLDAQDRLTWATDGEVLRRFEALGIGAAEQ
jgi:8-oxo-dGTP diphosphatase